MINYHMKRVIVIYFILSSFGRYYAKPTTNIVYVCTTEKCIQYNGCCTCNFTGGIM